MRLLIDLQGAQNNSRDRGIGRYSLALSKAIVKNRGDHSVFILLNGLFKDTIEPIKNAFDGLLTSDNFLVFNTPGPVSELECANDWRRLSAEALREYVIDLLEPDAVLVLSMIDGRMDDTVSTVGRIHSTVPVAVILYDLIPLADPDRYIGWEPARRWYFGKLDSLRRADLMLAISKSAALEAIELLDIEPSRIKNIFAAADPSFTSNNLTIDQIEAVGKKFGIKSRYLMHSSAFEPRKNFEGLVRAFAALNISIRADFQLVLVCKINDAEYIKLSNLGKSLGLSPVDLVLTGHVSDEELIALYSGCHLFVFPSFHEGFGLPALEAMCCGAPTIGSNATSIPEVIGRKDALFDPASDESIKCLIEKALTDETFYQSLKSHALLQSKRFSWDNSARITLDALENLVEKQLDSSQEIPGGISVKWQKFLQCIASISRHVPPTEVELRALAHHLLGNQRAVEVIRASAAFRGKLIWRIEGPFDSSYSLALLNRQTARALEQLGHTVVLHSTEGPGDFPANAKFLSTNPDLAEMHHRVNAWPHDKVDALSRNLYPPRVNDMTNGLNLLHHYAWEESGFPGEWATNFNNHLSAMTCLSEHVEKVMIDNGVKTPMAISGCGVDHWEQIELNQALRVEARSFRFLHVSSCFARKGIDVLLDAYGKAFTSTDDVTLIVKTFPNPHNEIHALLAECRSKINGYPHVVVLEEDLSESQLKSLYQQCNVLVAPSRAEGFGLPIAEAMLSGLPVITTKWGGQLDFCSEETAWMIDFTFARADTHFSLFGSAWAEPNVDMLAGTMLFLRNAPIRLLRSRTETGRRFLLNNFKWKDVTSRFVNAALDLASVNAPKSNIPRIGWVSTWNTKCGIASYSAHLISHIPHPVTVLAPYDKQNTENDSNCIRSWCCGKDENNFDELYADIGRSCLDIVVIQFNYGFFNLLDLSTLINKLINDGRIVVVELHSTVDPSGMSPEWNWKLSELLPALTRCQRILVHQINDLNRLKNLGLVENVALLPLGIIQKRTTTPKSRRNQIPLISSYGFCLPHKGLIELLQAVDILRNRGTPVRLQLLNAQYPSKTSEKLVNEIRLMIEKLSLCDLVDANHAYLSDNESLQLLDNSDLIVFPYQETNESASAAVRLGLASKRPVGVTPLQIFDELDNSVFKLQGTCPNAIADGIYDALQQLGKESEISLAISKSADAWRAAHSFEILATRFYNMLTKLYNSKTKIIYSFDGSSYQLKTQVGQIHGRSIVSKGKEGYLIYGPYIPLSAGYYLIKIIGEYNIVSNSVAFFDVVCNGGQDSLMHITLKNIGSGTIIDSVVYLRKSCNDMEIRLLVDSDAIFTVNQIQVHSTFVQTEMTSSR